MNPPAYKTMAEAVQGLKNRGFTSNLEYRDGALHAVGTAQTYSPRHVTIVEHHRFEGASDPDDMSVIYAIECTDGTRGTLVDAFGVYANPQLADFLKQVEVHETR